MIECNNCEYGTFKGSIAELQEWKPEDGYDKWQCGASIYDKGWLGCKKSDDGEEIPNFRRARVIFDGMFVTTDTQDAIAEALEKEGWHRVKHSTMGMPVIPEDLWFVAEYLH